MKKAMIVVSFGTSVPDARPCIDRVERALSHVTERTFFRAFTSPTIRRILAGRGEKIASLEEALAGAADMGYEDVVVQPTHLLYGIEYDKIKTAVGQFLGSFKKLSLGKPLISGERDLRDLAACLLSEYRPEKGALVLMGHGTTHFANMVYPAFQTALRLEGERAAFVGTVEGWPGFSDVLSQLKASGEKKVLLVPFMLVAGDHARHDMAGEGGWKSKLEAEGFETNCCMEGLGALKAVQDMYCERFEALLEEKNGF